jgi:hypothetical protein
MHDIFVSRCNEGEFHTLFQRLQRDPVEHKQYFRQEYCVSHQVKLSSAFPPPMWLRLSSGMAITTERVRTRLGHGTKFDSLSDPRCPALDLTGTWPFSVNVFVFPIGFLLKGQFLYFVYNDLTATWLRPDRDLLYSVNQPLMCETKFWTHRKNCTHS